MWRDKSTPFTEGLAKRIFFDSLFPMANCILTDRKQTSYGRAFWELRIYEAFQKNLPVYLVDQNTGTKNRLASAQEFDALADTWWTENGFYEGNLGLDITGKI